MSEEEIDFPVFIIPSEMDHETMDRMIKSMKEMWQWAVIREEEYHRRKMNNKTPEIPSGIILNDKKILFKKKYIYLKNKKNEVKNVKFSTNKETI